MNPTYFQHAQGMTIGPHASFQTVAGNATTHINYGCTHGGREVTLYGRTFRRIIDGDLILRHHLSSDVVSVEIKPEGDASTSSESQVVKIRTTKQTANVVGIGGVFTATMLEPVDDSDAERFKSVFVNFCRDYGVID
ncbi:hypothetical protein AAF712_016454 [Marasmius tenuissimus]|uniref:Uncharacterized protein n=1 Tax=Marasmius tenuissimus TaxID=585030 RepID=A0ABR2Z6Q2_9AGAR